MATSGSVAIGDDVLWAEIEPDGSETERTGRAWGPAPALAGMSAWWVIPADGSPAVLVARSSRRHQCGRALKVTVRSIDAQRRVVDRWVPGAGRVIDVGEWFRETDPRSRFNVRFTPPRYVRTQRPGPANAVGLALFATLCERAGRGENVDMSVTAADAAQAANVASGDE